MTQFSIRNRLLSFMVPLLLVVWGIFSAVVYSLTQDELQESHVAQAFQLAKALANLSNDRVSSFLIDEAHVFEDYYVEIRASDGKVLYKSSQMVAVPKELKTGMQEVRSGEKDWIIWTFPGEDTDQTYIVGIYVGEARDILRQTVLGVSLPLAIVFVFSIFATIYIVKRGLDPLTSLSQSLKVQEPEKLGKLETGNQPTELVPIVRSLNSLFDRIEDHLEREQRFIDDAAHEIRTPLTVVKAQCQVIERDKLDEATRQRFDNIMKGVDRATYLAAKLLEHARTGQDQNMVQKEQDLLPILQQSLAQQAHLADAKGIELQLLRAAHAKTIVDADDLGTILSNLIGNALRHTPENGQISAILRDEGECWTICIEDSGPGIQEAYRDKVFERFFSQNPAQSDRGAGLGLSIVRSLSKRNGIEISVAESESLGGASFSLKFKKSNDTQTMM
ncbi:sensor histidine kinase [Roseibium sp. SCP14]|uniref:sensor histidine kinase n=1 Tax=Roseibium sp. SCP14 TaxID=3141375 RepID=UPI0033351927